MTIWLNFVGKCHRYENVNNYLAGHGYTLHTSISIQHTVSHTYQLNNTQAFPYTHLATKNLAILMTQNPPTTNLEMVLLQIKYNDADRCWQFVPGTVDGIPMAEHVLCSFANTMSIMCPEKHKLITGILGKGGRYYGWYVMF